MLKDVEGVRWCEYRYPGASLGKWSIYGPFMDDLPAYEHGIFSIATDYRCHSALG